MTVQEVLDALLGGQMTLEEAVSDFASRNWPPRPTVTDAEIWGVTDRQGPTPDSWALVEAEPRLTSEQYQALGEAYKSATSR